MRLFLVQNVTLCIYCRIEDHRRHHQNQVICSDQKAISDWTLNTSNTSRSKSEDPIYDCIIKPEKRQKRSPKPPQNEHYYSSTPDHLDDLDDDCPALTEKKTDSFIRKLPPPIPPKPLTSESLSFTIKMARLRHEIPKIDDTSASVTEEGHLINESSSLQMNLDDLNKLNQMKTASYHFDDENTLCVISYPYTSFT